MSCLFEDMFKKDFIVYLTEHDDMSEDEAQDVWDMYGEDYIEDIYQEMSDAIWHYVHMWDKRKEKR